MLNSCAKTHECELKRSSQIFRISSASCLQQSSVRGLTRMFTLVKLKPFSVPASVFHHVSHSAHEETKMLHLEQSFMIYCNTCGGKTSLCAGKRSVIYFVPLPLAWINQLELILCTTAGVVLLFPTLSFVFSETVIVMLSHV